MLMVPEKPTADREQIARFVNVLFRNCITKTGLPYGGLVALRAFGPNNSVAHVSWAGLTDVIDRAADVATAMARKDAVVFCPPVCLFKDAEKRSAREIDILAAPVIAMDFDREPDKGRAALEAVLGQATLVVASGGLWQGQQNAHLYWRLKEPAVGPEQIALLKAVRKKAVEISGGDPTNVPACHPLRWPGSWHTKSTPALCRIVDEAPDVELTLEDAAHLLGVDPDQVARERREKEERKGSDTEDHPADLLRATEYLATVREKGVPAQGDGSDKFTFGVIAKLRDFGVSEYAACDLLDEYFTPHTSFDAEWVEAKVANAYKHAQNPPGVKSITTLFDVLGDPEPVHEASALFAEVDLNALKNERAEQLASKFTLIPFEDAARLAVEEVAPPLIKGLLDQGTLSCLYGDSNVGKTFVAMDLAYHISAGRSYAGMKTQAGLVVYVAAEGGRGAKRRLAALKQKFGGSDWPDFVLLPASVDFRNPEIDLNAFKTALAMLGRPIALIVIDTLSRALAGGDENGSVDMGAFVRNVDAVRNATGAHVLIVHHTGKDKAKGARGHTLLRAALDTEIEIAEGLISVTKQRDLDKSWTSAFRLEVRELGRDADGDRITSCTVRLDGVTAERRGEPTEGEAAVLACIDMLAETAHKPEHGARTSDLEAWCKANLSGMTRDALNAHLRGLRQKRLIDQPKRGHWLGVAQRHFQGPDVLECVEKASTHSSFGQSVQSESVGMCGQSVEGIFS